MIIARQPTLGFSFASAGGVAGTAASALSTAGIGAAIGIGTSIVGDLLSCGTVGQRGCQKRSDAALQLAGMAKIRQIAYAAESGQLDPSAAIQQIGQVGQAVYSGYENKASGNDIKQQGCAQVSNVPANSQSAQLLCNVDTTLSDYVSQFQALVASFSASPMPSPAAQPILAPAPSPASATASQPAAPVAAPETSSGPSLSTIAVLGAGAAVAFMVLR